MIGRSDDPHVLLRAARRGAAVTALVAAVAHADVADVPASRDNTLYETPAGDRSNGAGAHTFVGRTDDGQRRRALYAFDVAGSVPAGSTITAATLTLFMSRTQAGPTPVSVHTVLADWGEAGSDAPGQEGGGAPAAPGDATWLHRQYPDVSWAAAGGDFGPSLASVSVGGVGSYSWSGPAMVADVQSWLDDPATAYGWILLGGEGATHTAKRFDTRENPDASRRPVLTIEFMPPDGGGDFTYYRDADRDGFGTPRDSIVVSDDVPPAGYVANALDCDDTNPQVNPDATEDCDNGIDDDCDGVTDGCGNDCNGNGVNDVVDVTMGTSLDCDRNGRPDECDLADGGDANGNGILDACEVSCCTAGDLRSIRMQYTGDDCGATSHGQDAGDVECSDQGPLPATVFVRATDDPDPDEDDAKVYFAGTVSIGATFLVDAQAAGQTELDSRTSVHVFSPDGGTVLQSVEFRTSCSDPLAVGDQFGASLVVGCTGVGDTGGGPCPADVNGDGTVDVDDLVGVILAFGSADASADITGDGSVDVDDLVGVLLTWGPCPG